MPYNFWHRKTLCSGIRGSIGIRTFGLAVVFSGKFRIFQTGHQMDYIRLVINIVLTIAFYYLFGRVNIATFSKASVSITKIEETMTKVPSPGNT